MFRLGSYISDVDEGGGGTRWLLCAMTGITYVQNFLKINAQERHKSTEVKLPSKQTQPFIHLRGTIGKLERLRGPEGEREEGKGGG